MSKYFDILFVKILRQVNYYLFTFKYCKEKKSFIIKEIFKHLKEKRYMKIIF